MKSTVIENTGIRVSRLAFGTATMHHLFRAGDRQRLLATAAASGLTHFDTSPFYGLGLAESDLGKFLRGRRSSVTVATKVGLYPHGNACGNVTAVWLRKAAGRLFPTMSLPEINWSVARARSSLQDSLRRLSTDYVDFLFLHEPDIALIDVDEFASWIEAERALGTVRGWGLAGAADLVAPWVQAGSPLARVVQTRDSLDMKEADFMLAAGRQLQFTYGYLSSRVPAGLDATPASILRGAMGRNTHGSIIASTRRVDRIGQWAQAMT